MTTEEQEFTDFMTEASIKAMELRQKYDKLSENNKRRKDPPKPLFPVSEIDFHWKEITELEKYNPFTWNRRNIDLGK